METKKQVYRFIKRSTDRAARRKLYSRGQDIKFPVRLVIRKASVNMARQFNNALYLGDPGNYMGLLRADHF